jgi:protein subunit release factor B
MTAGKELLFSVTARDLVFSYSRGTGKGGQKRNKTESHVRCVHPPSGAAGESDDTRSQHQNKQIAFERMARSARFQSWARIEVARCTGRLQAAEERIDQEMRTNLSIQAKDDQ